MLGLNQVTESARLRPTGTFQAKQYLCLNQWKLSKNR